MTLLLVGPFLEPAPEMSFVVQRVASATPYERLVIERRSAICRALMSLLPPSEIADRAKAVLDAALDCIICMDSGGRIQEFNPAAERTFGYRRDEVLGQELADVIVPPALRESHRTGLSRYLATGEGPVLGRRIEIAGMRSDGCIIQVELAITVTQTSAGPFFTAYLRDITERRRQEVRREIQYALADCLACSRALREVSSQILELTAKLGEWSYGGIWVYDPEICSLSAAGIWTAPDKSASEFVRATKATSLRPGEGLPGWVFESKSEIWIPDVRRDQRFIRGGAAEASGMLGAFAFPLFAGSRVLGVIEHLGPSVADPDPDLVKVTTAIGSHIGQFIDREQAERQLEYQKQIAVDANAAKDRFIAMISHDLRAPLSPISLWLQDLLEESGHAPEFKADLERAYRCIQMETRLIDDLLDAAKLRHHKLVLECSFCDLNELLQDSAAALASQIEAKTLCLKLDLCHKSVSVNVDPIRMRQVFQNLLGNACKFTPEGGIIVLRTRTEEGFVIADVEDAGVGIPPELIDKIFEMFEQGLRDRSGGLGLGLAISKSIVELHGGSLHVSSQGEKRGSIFTVKLPVKAPKDSVGD